MTNLSGYLVWAFFFFKSKKWRNVSWIWYLTSKILWAIIADDYELLKKEFGSKKEKSKFQKVHSDFWRKGCTYVCLPFYKNSYLLRKIFLLRFYKLIKTYIMSEIFIVLSDFEIFDIGKTDKVL